MFALIAIVAFALYTFGVNFEVVNLLGAGLVFLTLHLLVPIVPGWVSRNDRVP